jgi:hypothetical protein
MNRMIAILSLILACTVSASAQVISTLKVCVLTK